MSGGVLWAASAGLLFGVFIRSFSELAWPTALFIALIGLATIASSMIRRRAILTFVGVALIACSAGVLRMESARLVGDPVLSDHIGSSVVLEGTVVAEPDIRERSVRLSVRAERMLTGSSTVPVNAKVLVVAPAYTEISYGDTVRAEGKLRLPEEFDTGAGRVFDYPMFLAKDGILYQLAFADVTPLGENSGNFLKKAAIDLKHIYIQGLRQALPEPAAGLAGGITVGDKRSLGEDLTAAFQNVSLIHIVVLSGYNMTVVINAAAHVFSFVPRYAQFALSAAIVGLFILMTGGAASATRAGSMALIATYARLTGRSFVALRVLAVVAFVMVLWNPFVLAFDPGFQLSMLATAGLILFTPIVAAWLPFVTERFALREIAASTLATQAAVLPLLLYQNGLLSFIAIPANLLSLVVVPLAMLASFIAAIAGLLFGPFSAVFGLPALVLLSYIIAVAEYLSAVPFAAITIPAFGAWILCAAYATLVAAYFLFTKENARD